MNSAPSGVNLAVRNRQRTHKVDVALLKKLTYRALAASPSKLQTLSIVLVSDTAMARLNLQYHQTAGPTDILSFDYGEGQGELVISVERAVAQARQFGTTSSRELALYIVHGLLHLGGYDDRRPAQQRRMHIAERHVLTLLARECDFRRLITGTT